MGNVQQKAVKWRRIAQLMLWGDPETGIVPKSAYEAYLVVYPKSSAIAARASFAKVMRSDEWKQIWREECDEYRSACIFHPLCTRQKQAEVLVERWHAIHRILAERAEDLRENEGVRGEDCDPPKQNESEFAWNERVAGRIAGGATGIICREVKDGRTVYAADLGLLRELREIEKRLLELSGDDPGSRLDLTTGGKPIHAGGDYDLSKLTLQERAEMHAILSKAQVSDPDGA